MTINEYTNELVELILKTAEIDPLVRHKVIKKVHSFKPFKENKFKVIHTTRIATPRRAKATIVFSQLPPKIQKIMYLSCEKHEIDIYTFCSNRRLVEIVDAQRQVIYFLHRDMKISSKKVGLWFMKDHSTILHACNTHRDYYETNKIYSKIYDYFKQEALKIISED